MFLSHRAAQAEYFELADGKTAEATAKSAADPRTQPRAVIDLNAEPATASSSDILGKTFGVTQPTAWSRLISCATSSCKAHRFSS